MRRWLNTGNLITCLAVWLGLSMTAVTVIGILAAGPNGRAIILMGACLVLAWVGMCGLAMRLFRDPCRRGILAIGAGWQIKFVVFATLLAMLEEAITTTLTNLAPLFGVPVGSAYITASANYIDVVCFHSVVVFVPMFIAWSVILRHYDFSPNAVFLLFGITGVLAETMLAGIQALVQFGMWIFVYGLMVYLPAFTIPTRQGIKRPKLLHYLMAVLLPLVCAAPVAALVSSLHPVSVHFPPIPPGS